MEPFSSYKPFHRRNERGREGERAQSRTSCLENHGRERGRGHSKPPWLTGKALGLYYRDRMKAEHAQAKVKVTRLPQNIQDEILLLSNELHNNIYNNQKQAENTNRKLEDKYSFIQDSEFKRKFLRVVSDNLQDKFAKAVHEDLRVERDTSIDNSLLADYESKISTQQYKSMLQFRKKLPAYDKQSEILKLVNENQVVVISGETGCGKTTQIAQFILDDQIKKLNGSVTRIICTQPRRISAISVAERVAAERTEKLGVSVGFSIRLERVMPRNRGSILFCTSGLLLKFIETDPILNNYSHVILDEIHERTTEIDFNMALLKLITKIRPDLKVLLMSATVNSERFSQYYDDCPIIHIPGFTYPVTEYYLEDVLQVTRFKFNKHDDNKYSRGQNDDFHSLIYWYTARLRQEKKYPRFVIDQLKNPQSENLSLLLIERLIRYICTTKPPGAILVFLPGMMDISQLFTIMKRNKQYPQNRYVIYPLHSRMATVNQRIIFKEPPMGVRKIIIATPIAEASITIEDVVYVVDSGRMKFLQFDMTRNVETLRLQWVSMANSKQRRGRAGRVKPGICYHLYSKVRETTFNEYPLPEMLIRRLEEVILQIKILQLGDVRSFLSNVMDPPSVTAIQMSLDQLRELKALDSQENLTPLGYHLAQLPLHPQMGKMVIWAALFSCLEPVLAIASSLSFKDAFYFPLENEAEAREKKLELGLNEYSDHIVLAEALRRYESYTMRDASRFCHEYFLSSNTLKLLSGMKSQIAQHLCEMKFLESDNPSDPNANMNSNNIMLVKAIVCAGLYPNIAKVYETTKGVVHAWTAEDGCVTIHPSSINSKPGYVTPSNYITYFTKQLSTSTFLYDTTYVSTPILFFAATIKKMEPYGDYVKLICSGTEFIVCDVRTMEFVMSLQIKFNNFITYKLTHPGTTRWNTYEGGILNAIIHMVNYKDTDEPAEMVSLQGYNVTLNGVNR